MRFVKKTAVLRLVSVAAVASVVVAALATSAGATVLLPGASNSKPGTVPPLPGPNYTSGIPAYLSGAHGTGLVSLTSVFSVTQFGITLAGTLDSDVFVNPNTGTLSFRYQWFNDPRSNTDIVRATLAALWNPGLLAITDAGASLLPPGSTTPGGVAPSWSTGDPRFIFWDSNLHQISIQFRAENSGTVMEQGQNSSLVWFETTAPAYAISNAGILDGVAANAAYLGPAIPEPSTIIVWSSLMALGIGVAFWRRRREQ